MSVFTDNGYPHPTPALKAAFRDLKELLHHTTLSPRELNLLLIMLQEYFKDKEKAN